MYKLSDFLSKPVISLYEAKEIGTAYNVFFDDKMLKPRRLEVLKEGDCDSYVYISPLNIVFPVVDAICIKNLGAVSSLPDDNGCYSPVNSPCYDADGKFIGTVTDVVFDKNGVTQILVGENVIEPQRVVKLNSSLLLIKPENGKYKPVPPILKRLKPENNVGSSVEKETERIVVPAPILSKKKPDSPSVPEKLSAGKVTVNAFADRYSFLFGKTIIKNLGAPLLMHAGDKVTQEVVAKAEKCGKLVTLALNAE